MKIVKTSEAPEIKNPHNVSVCRLCDSEHAQVMMVKLQPGERLKRHISPVDVVFYVVEGEGLVQIGDEEMSACADTLVESPARIPHCLVNPSDDVFRVLVIKTPRPTEPTRIL